MESIDAIHRSPLSPEEAEEFRSQANRSVDGVRPPAAKKTETERPVEEEYPELLTESSPEPATTKNEPPGPGFEQKVAKHGQEHSDELVRDVEVRERRMP